MKRLISALMAAAAFAGALVSMEAWAQELTVESYVDASLARLEMVRDTLAQENRMPLPLEEGLLWQQRGTTAEAFYAFRSLYPQEVNAYLAANPATAAEIEQLSAEIHSRIAQQE